MPFVQAGRIVTYYLDEGPRDAPVVLLSNSLGTSLQVWDDQAPALARAHRVVRYDMRGHGLTEMTASGVGSDTVEALADDAIALLDALGIARASIVGLSIGGAVAQRLAAAYPDRVDALVLCATANKIGTEASWNERIAAVEGGGMDAVVDTLLARWFPAWIHAERPALIAGFGTMLRRTPTDGYVAGCRAMRDADLRADDARIRARTLVIAGSEDPTTPPTLGAEICATIPSAEMIVIDGASHIIGATCPDETNAALLRFLERR